MSSLYRFAEDIIAKSIVAAMKPRGGIRPVSIRARRLASFGLKHIRCQAIGQAGSKLRNEANLEAGSL
jgi:hypothetical protein